MATYNSQIPDPRGDTRRESLLDATAMLPERRVEDRPVFFDFSQCVSPGGYLYVGGKAATLLDRDIMNLVVDPRFAELLTVITVINFDGCPNITDASLGYIESNLSKMPNLNAVFLSRSKVTNEACVKFQRDHTIRVNAD